MSQPEPTAMEDLTVTDFEDAIRRDSQVQRWRNVCAVLRNLHRVKPNMPEDLYKEAVDYIRQPFWIAAVKSPTDHESYKRLKGIAGRHCTNRRAYWPDLLILQSIFPNSAVTKEVVDQFSRRLGASFDRNRASFPTSGGPEWLSLLFRGTSPVGDKVAVSDDISLFCSPTSTPERLPSESGDESCYIDLEQGGRRQLGDAIDEMHATFEHVQKRAIAPISIMFAFFSIVIDMFKRQPRIWELFPKEALELADEHTQRSGGHKERLARFCDKVSEAARELIDSDDAVEDQCRPAEERRRKRQRVD